MHVTLNHGSQKGFLRHLEDNYRVHKIAGSPYYSLLDKHLRAYRLHSAWEGKILPKGLFLVQVVKMMLLRHKMYELRK